MNKRSFLQHGLSLATVAAWPLATHAQGNGLTPGKPVTVVVPYATGGAVDAVARLVSQQLGGPLGNPVVVDNRTGAGGAIGWGSVARAAPDGHTLGAIDLSFAIAASLVPNLPFDARKAFAHITTAATVPHVIVVNPQVEARTIQELIALLKAKPGRLNYGSGGIGTNTHLGAELFKAQTGTFMTHIPYRGAGGVLTDLMGGQVQMLVTTVATALPHIKAGKLRALMVMGEQRSPVLPEVPSARESGLPGLVMDFWVGFAAPAGTPQPLLDKFEKDIATVLALPDVKKRMADMGLTPVGSSQAATRQRIDGEMKRWSDLIRQQGIKPE